jgi:hypothetical protein
MTMKYTNIFNPKAFIKTFPNWHFGLKMYHLATLLDFGAIFSLLLPPAEKNDFFPRNIFSLSLFGAPQIRENRTNGKKSAMTAALKII